MIVTCETTEKLINCVLWLHEWGTSYFSTDDGVDSGSAISHHVNEFGLGEELRQVNCTLQCERVLVAEARRRLTMFGYDF